MVSVVCLFLCLSSVLVVIVVFIFIMLICVGVIGLLVVRLSRWWMLVMVVLWYCLGFFDSSLCVMSVLLGCCVMMLVNVLLWLI